MVRFSRLAESDLLSIGSYTLRTWGESQSKRYLDELEAACQQLAGDTALGRACDDVRPGLRRHEQGKHVIFFRHHGAGILVSRVLHERMLPGIHQFGDM